MTVSMMTPHASVRLVAIRVGSLAACALVAVAFVVTDGIVEILRRPAQHS
jgi:hypothetical protein